MIITGFASTQLMIILEYMKTFFPVSLPYSFPATGSKLGIWFCPFSTLPASLGNSTLNPLGNSCVAFTLLGKQTRGL